MVSGLGTNRGIPLGVEVVNRTAVTPIQRRCCRGSIGVLGSYTSLFGYHPLDGHRNKLVMATWPRQIQSHVMDREVVVVAGNEEYRYRCIHCGAEIDDPTDPGSELQICDRDPLLPMR